MYVAMNIINPGSILETLPDVVQWCRGSVHLYLFKLLPYMEALIREDIPVIIIKPATHVCVQVCIH